jgi:hypothetical protein
MNEHKTPCLIKSAGFIITNDEVTKGFIPVNIGNVSDKTKGGASMRRRFFARFALGLGVCLYAVSFVLVSVCVAAPETSATYYPDTVGIRG